MGASLPSAPAFRPPSQTRPPTFTFQDDFAAIPRVPHHWALVVDEPTKDHPGCRPPRLIADSGLSFPSPSLLQSRRMYCPYRQRVVVRGRVQVHGVRNPEVLTPRTKDAVVWFCCTRSLGYGNGILCSLVVRHFFRDFHFSRYEMHIAASVAPYRLPTPSAPPLEVVLDRSVPETLFPFHSPHEMHTEPSNIDIFDFQVTDDGRQVVFRLDRYTERGNSAHTMALSTPFQAGPNQDCCHVGFGAGDALYDRVVLTDLVVVGCPTQRRFLTTDVFRGTWSEVKISVLMAAHERLGAASTLRDLPHALLYHILQYLSWSEVQFFHDQRSGRLGAERLPQLRDPDDHPLALGVPDSAPPPATPRSAEWASSVSETSDTSDAYSDVVPAARRFIATPNTKWSELWWQPKAVMNLLMSRRDFAFRSGALLVILRFTYSRPQKRLAVISRVTWSYSKRSPDDFSFIGMTFGISGGPASMDPVRLQDPREVFEMAVTVGGRILSSQLFGSVELGDVLEYHIYDDGQEYAFKVLHVPRCVVEEAGLGTPEALNRPIPTLEAAPDLFCTDAASCHPELPGARKASIDSSIGSRSMLMPEEKEEDVDDSRSASSVSSSSLASLTPGVTCNAYILRGCFHWFPAEFPIILTLMEDDPVHCALSDVEYDHFAVHQLHHRGCPF